MTIRPLTKDQVHKNCLEDLLALLRANPAGLRRWTVMRAMRMRRQKAGRDIGLNFEKEVECIFFGHCSGHPLRAKLGNHSPELFYRPTGRAGEVWAAYGKQGLCSDSN